MNVVEVTRAHAQKKIETYRGLIRCVAVNITPSRTHKPATMTYAIPKNGFLPPITVRVLIRIPFVPLKARTGKSVTSTHARNKSNQQLRYLQSWIVIW